MNLDSRGGFESGLRYIIQRKLGELDHPKIITCTMLSGDTGYNAVSILAKSLYYVAYTTISLVVMEFTITSREDLHFS